MASQCESAAIAVVDRVPVEIDKILSLATRVLNEHTNELGLCAVCGSAWPCQSVILADHNLAGL